MALARTVGYAHAYSFKYSPRPGTPAADLPQVDGSAKADRLARLQLRLSLDQAAFNASFVGRTVPVLFDKPGREPGQLVGRSPHLQAVFAEVPESLLGRIVELRIEEARPNALGGARPLA
jgi:tRNA-2-methylthio-N6-dimethylallyladenosine synthase